MKWQVLKSQEKYFGKLLVMFAKYFWISPHPGHNTLGWAKLSGPTLASEFAEWMNGCRSSQWCMRWGYLMFRVLRKEFVIWGKKEVFSEQGPLRQNVPSVKKFSCLGQGRGIAQGLRVLCGSDLFIYFWLFYGPTQESNWSLRHWPASQPRQSHIWATSEMYPVAHGNTRRFTFWGRPWIELHPHGQWLGS